MNTQLAAGKTIAALAKEKGVDINKIIATYVAEEQAEHPDMSAADVTARVTARVNNAGKGGRDGRGGRDGSDGDGTGHRGKGGGRHGHGGKGDDNDADDNETSTKSTQAPTTKAA